MTRPKVLRFTAILEKSTNKLWGSHLRVPQSVAVKLIRSGSRRVLRTLNGSDAHQCALLPYGEGSFVLSVNKKWCDALHLKIGSEARVSLQRDESTYGLPMPEELEELLRQDNEGNRLFHALTSGRQRTLLYIIGSARNPDARAWRASSIIRHLKDNNGKINYRQLNQSLKRR
ncbi:MAG: hypothetical protein HW389_1501 [Bacteroidetes bacterium]|nr:hypothetical protein [Bacteroidota bacterium]MBM2845596.1 hypothetical protein [Bacteroidota bacterium]